MKRYCTNYSIKLYSFFLGYLLVINHSYAQTHTESFTGCSKSYTAVCDLQNDGSIKVNIRDGLDTSNSTLFSITTSDIDIFATAFSESFFKLKDTKGCTIKNDTDKIVSFGRRLYLNYLKSISDTSSPKAGLLKLFDTVTVNTRYKTLDGGHVNLYDFKDEQGKILKAQIEISDGYLTNLKAYVTLKNQTYQYLLPFAVGISSIGNIKKFKNFKLFEVNSPVHFGPLKKQQKQLVKNKALKNIALDSSRFIYLSDLISYDNYYQVGRRDYSPRDQEIDFSAGESKILYKTQTNKLFEAHIFTDFIGLNDEKPNGLVQTEVNKQININSVQSITPRILYRSLIKSIGIFQYITPNIAFSKIEQHNSRLDLGDLDSIRANSGASDTSKFNHSVHRYATALNLYQYQTFSAGLDFNILYLNNNDLKFSFDINFGAKIGITKVTDSLTKVINNNISKSGFVNNYSINTLQFYPEVIIKFLPEERFSLSLSDRFMYLKALNPNLQLIEADKNDNTKVHGVNASWLNSLQMLMTIQVNPNSKLFGRVGFNSELQNSKDNFAQVQVGYSTFILGK